MHEQIAQARFLKLDLWHGTPEIKKAPKEAPQCHHICMGTLKLSMRVSSLKSRQALFPLKLQGVVTLTPAWAPYCGWAAVPGFPIVETKGWAGWYSMGGKKTEKLIPLCC